MNLARYRSADLPELMDKIMTNSIGINDDYLDKFFNVSHTSNYPPFNLIQVNNVESKLEVASQGSRKMTSKSIRSMENYLWKARKKLRKQMENLSTGDWPNVPLNDNGRSQTIRRLDPSALPTDSSPWT